MQRDDFLIIGYGNTLRGDDGAGPRVAEAVAALNYPGVRTLVCPLLTPELADPISRAGAVLFVDAAVDAPHEVRLRELEPAKPAIEVEILEEPTHEQMEVFYAAARTEGFALAVDAAAPAANAAATEPRTQ